MRLFLTFILILWFSPIHAQASMLNDCPMVPRNNLRFPIRPGIESAVSEADFKALLERAQRLYAPVYRDVIGGDFVVDGQWKSEAANAYADVPKIRAGRPTLYRIELHGGMARHPLMTEDAFMLVICHEIGHHLGGFPRKTMPTWASTEGQSDYFSTAKCARLMFAASTRQEWAKPVQVSSAVRAQCAQAFPGQPLEAAICMRSTVAGLSLARVLHTFEGNIKAPDLGSRDLSSVPTTFDGHPISQCRLDTYRAGALCQVPATVPFSAVDSKPGACLRGLTVQAERPACWFAEQVLSLRP